MSDAERLKALEKQAANLEAAVFDKTQETELLRRRVEIGSGPGGCNYAGTLVDQLEKQLRDLQKENAVAKMNAEIQKKENSLLIKQIDIIRNSSELVADPNQVKRQLKDFDPGERSSEEAVDWNQLEQHLRLQKAKNEMEQDNARLGLQVIMARTMLADHGLSVQFSDESLLQAAGKFAGAHTNTALTKTSSALGAQRSRSRTMSAEDVATTTYKQVNVLKRAYFGVRDERNDLRAQVKKTHMRQVFEEIDTDRSGTLDKKEIRSAMLKLGHHSKGELIAVFEAMQTEELDFEQFCQLMGMVQRN